MINKLRALNSWYTKGLDNGSHLRVSVNAAESIPQLREIVAEFFSQELATRLAAVPPLALSARPGARTESVDRRASRACRGVQAGEAASDQSEEMSSIISKS